MIDSPCSMKKAFVVIILGLFFFSIGEAATRSAQDLIQDLQKWQTELSEDQKLTNEERDLRIDLTHRLIFQVEAKYKEQAPRQTMKVILLDMKSTDSVSSRFLLNLLKSFEESLEPNENPVVFIRDYTEYSSVSQPEPWENFARERDYFDGKTSFSASPMTPEEAADQAEKTLQSPEVPAQILFEKKLAEEVKLSPPSSH